MLDTILSLFSRKQRLQNKRIELKKELGALVDWADKEGCIGAMMAIKPEWVRLKTDVALIDLELNKINS